MWIQVHVYVANSSQSLKSQCVLRLTPRRYRQISLGEERTASLETDPQSAATATRMHPAQIPEPGDQTVLTPHQNSKLSIAAVTQVRLVAAARRWGVCAGQN